MKSEDHTPGTIILTLAWVITAFLPAYLRMFATEPTLFIQAGSTFVIFLVTGVLVGALSLAQTAMARPASIGFVIAGWVAYDEMRSSFVVRGMWGWVPVIGLAVLLTYNAWVTTRRCVT